MRAEEHRRPIAYAWIGVLVLAATVGWMFQTQFMWRYLMLQDSDVLIFRQAAEAVRDGLPLYDLRFGEAGGWTWPPFGAIAVLPTLVVPLDLLLPVSYAVSTACLVVVVALCARPLLDRAPDRIGRALGLVGLTLLAVPLTPVADTLGLGQIGLVLLLLVTLDLVVVSRRWPRWHGVLIGIATAIKVTPGLFVVHLLATRQWRAAATAVATTLACWMLAAAVLWRDSADYWGRGLLLAVNDRVDGFGSWVYNQSWMGLVDGLPSPWPMALWLLLSTATVVIVLMASARARSRRRGAGARTRRARERAGDTDRLAPPRRLGSARPPRRRGGRQDRLAHGRRRHRGGAAHGPLTPADAAAGPLRRRVRRAARADARRRTAGILCDAGDQRVAVATRRPSSTRTVPLT